MIRAEEYERADRYLQEKRLYDFRLLSTLGLTEEDAAAFAGLDGVELSAKKGYVVADPETCQSSRKGVFAGGDTVTGPKTVISAMGAGKKAAKAIADYLR